MELAFNLRVILSQEPYAKVASSAIDLGSLSLLPVNREQAAGWLWTIPGAKSPSRQHQFVNGKGCYRQQLARISRRDAAAGHH